MNSLQTVRLPFANTDLAKAWSIPKFPPFNIGALLEVNRKNAAALTKANQVVFDGLKTFAQRERDLFKSTVADCTQATRDVMAGTSVEERATKQADGARHIYASSVARFLELSDIAVKTNLSAMDILNARVTEAFDEFRALFVGRGTSTPTGVGPSITAAPVAVVEKVAPILDVVAAVSSAATGTPTAAPRTAARVAKAGSKTSKRASKAASKTPAKVAARARTSRR